MGDKLKQAIALLSSLSQHEGDETSEGHGSSSADSSRQRGTASCSRALDAVRSVRERLRTGGENARLEHRANFAPYPKPQRSSSAKPKSWNPIFFCLSNKNSVRVPCGVHERESLVEAGLGEKKVHIADLSCSVEQFHSAIISEFPKLKGCGGFELLRCIPNTKDLDVISSNIAQSPKLLKSVIGSGRVFVRPIQKNLALSADQSLVSTVEVKEECIYCKKLIATSHLRKHINRCKWENFKTDLDSDSDFEENVGKKPKVASYIDLSAASNSPEQQEHVDDVSETEHAMIQHAITLSTPSNSASEPQVISDHDCETLAEVLNTLSRNVKQEEVLFVVRRECVLEDALRTVRRKSFCATHSVKVEFLGEVGEDGGGLTREFWTLLFKDIKSSLCEGYGGCYVFRHDSVGLQNQKFFHVGRLIAMGLAQGSSGCPFLSPPVYQYLCGTDMLSVKVCRDDIPNFEVQHFLEQIESAQDEKSLRDVCMSQVDLTIDAGYTKPISSISLDDKGEMMKTLMLHFTLFRSKAVLDQLKEGLQALGVLRALSKYSEVLEPLFLARRLKTITADIFKRLIGAVQFSEQGTSDFIKEKATYMLFLDFLHQTEENDDGDICLSDVLSFCTGSEHPPPLGFDSPLTVRFCGVGEFPMASTCALELTLPTKYHNNVEMFTSKLKYGFLNHGGFGVL